MSHGRSERTERPLSGGSSDVSDVSDSDSGSSAGESTVLDVMDEPLFHVLGQFLTSGNKNIADILADLVKEVAQLRAGLAAIESRLST